MMCTRCKKRPAVMFISAISGTERKNEGLCLSCAKEMGLPQASEYLSQMGISEEDFENACDSMLNDNGGIDDELLSNSALTAQRQKRTRKGRLTLPNQRRRNLCLSAAVREPFPIF